MIVLVVKSEFKGYRIGDRIIDPVEIAVILDSAHIVNVVKADHVIETEEQAEA